MSKLTDIDNKIDLIDACKRISMAVFSILIILFFNPANQQYLTVEAQSANTNSGNTAKLKTALFDASTLSLEIASIALDVPTKKDSGLDAEFNEKQNNLKDFYSKLTTDFNYELQIRAEVNRLVSFLKRQGSRVASYNYARQIITLAKANGADYKIVVAIMGIESGFCNANYKVYNCFGYLNGVLYSSFTHAFNVLVPKVSREYARKYGTDFKSLAKAYGMVNFELHSKKMAAYYYSI